MFCRCRHDRLTPLDFDTPGTLPEPGNRGWGTFGIQRLNLRCLNDGLGTVFFVRAQTVRVLRRFRLRDDGNSSALLNKPLDRWLAQAALFREPVATSNGSAQAVWEIWFRRGDRWNR